MFIEELVSVLFKQFSKVIEEGTLLNLFHKLRISLMSKLDKDISSVQSLSCVPFFVTPWTTALKSSLSITSP